MNRIQHIKVVSTAPEEVRTFLRDIAGLPEGFDIPSYGDASGAGAPPAQADPPKTDLAWEDIASKHRMNGQPGFISGSVETRQIQVFGSDQASIWAIAIGTRDVEGVHAKCLERGLPTTPVVVTPFNGGNIRAFFVIVGGITFEFLRVEPSDSAQ